eukprot:COSAG01_NODE_29599_length_634_cov_0.732710_1_plen_35_part_10
MPSPSAGVEVSGASGYADSDGDGGDYDDEGYPTFV